MMGNELSQFPNGEVNGTNIDNDEDMKLNESVEEPSDQMSKCTDTFEHYDHDIYAVNRKTNSIVKVSDESAAAYGSVIITHDWKLINPIHRWKLKILRVRGLCSIGINNVNALEISGTCHRTMLYGYQSRGGTFNDSEWMKSGITFGKDDVVCIELDLYQRTLTFSVMRKSESQLVKVREYKIQQSLQSGYCLSLQMECAGDSVALLSYTEEKSILSSQINEVHLDNMNKVDEKKEEHDALDEYFKYCNKNIYLLSNHDHTITKRTNTVLLSAYGSQDINICPNATKQNVHHWKLKILKLQDVAMPCYIGVHPVDLIDIRISNSITNNIHYCYGSTGKKYSINNKKSKKFHIAYHEGDIIDMEFDVQTLYLGFGVNESQIIKAFQLAPNSANRNYCLAVGMVNTNDIIQILSYVNDNNTSMIAEKSRKNNAKKENIILMGDLMQLTSHLKCLKRFDEFRDYGAYKASSDGQTLRRIQGCTGAAYGANIILYQQSNIGGIHHWRIKILMMSADQRFIGIHHADNKMSASSKMRDVIHYGFGSFGKKFKDNKRTTSNFNNSFGTGDIVSVVLDLTAGRLGFSVNESLIQEAYKIDITNDGYCLAVCLGKGDTVTLLSYNIYASHDDKSNDNPPVIHIDKSLENKHPYIFNDVQLRELQEQNESLKLLLNNALNESKQSQSHRQQLKNKLSKLQQHNINNQKQISVLQKSNDELQTQLDELNTVPNKINKLNMQQLNALEAKLQNGIRNIQQARCGLMEQTYNCIVCMENPRNIVMDGCNHFVLCNECEVQLQKKLCPICQAPFSIARALTF